MQGQNTQTETRTQPAAEPARDFLFAAEPYFRLRERRWPLRNDPEARFENLALRNGWRPTKRGWPDFLCFDPDSGEVIAVEVKPRGKRGKLKRLKKDQIRCMVFLQSKGVRCFVSDGITLEKFNPVIHGNSS